MWVWDRGHVNWCLKAQNYIYICFINESMRKFPAGKMPSWTSAEGKCHFEELRKIRSASNDLFIEMFLVQQ